MTAYVTVEFTIKNKEMLQSYSAKAASTIAEFGGEFLVKAPIRSLGGVANYENKAIVAFPTKERAENWFHSPQYQNLIDIRNQGMESSFLLIA
ncbi:DUF1330 domain-containing protein [Aurantivibrio infirmus]